MHAGEFTLLTPPGPAAVAVVRLRGPCLEEFCAAHLARQASDRATTSLGAATHGCAAPLQAGLPRRRMLLDGAGNPLDDVIASIHIGTRGERELRIHIHGAPAVWEAVRAMLRAAAWRETSATTEDGAGLWSESDSVAAAAWARLPDALTLTGVRWFNHQALVLPGALGEVAAAPPARARELAAALLARSAWQNWYSVPMRIVLLGPPNAGKSTLMNALAGVDVSIATPEPGTTRDWIEAPGEVGGFPVTWIDTAGVRETSDALEARGISATQREAERADVVCLVLDADPQAWDAQLGFLDRLAGAVRALGTGRRACVVAINKIDAFPDPSELRRRLPLEPVCAAIPISAACGVGLAALRERLLVSVGRLAEETFLPAPVTSAQIAWLGERAGL